MEAPSASDASNSSTKPKATLPPHLSPSTDLSALSVGELRALLAEAKTAVPAGCNEKSELVALVERHRAELLARPRMSGLQPVQMHGRLADPDWAPPLVLIKSDRIARAGYNSYDSSEFVDDERTLTLKVRLLAQLMKRARNCAVYAGAGLSTSSGIDDYASDSKGVAMQKPRLRTGFDAQPTPAHRAIGALHHAGLIHHFVQQNHDGLPQKAAFPPEHINEIHGAWYDPSNPVVPMSGTLRSDLFEWLAEWAKKADLTLAVGTSLCGMNADRMVATPNKKALRGEAIGAAIISLQRTVHDEHSALKIYCKLDDAFQRLCDELSISVPPLQPYRPHYPAANEVSPNVFAVPYDKNGRLIKAERNLPAGSLPSGRWDLSNGAHVKVTSGPGEGFEGDIVGRNNEGHYLISLPCIREGDPRHGKGLVNYVLGSWWVQTAVEGKCALLPVVNCAAKK